MEVNTLVRQFIKTELVTDHNYADLQDSDPLLTTGIIDSLGIVKILAFIQEQFGVNIDDREIIPENFETVQAIAALIQKKLA